MARINVYGTAPWSVPQADNKEYWGKHFTIVTDIAIGATIDDFKESEISEALFTCFHPIGCDASTIKYEVTPDKVGDVRYEFVTDDTSITENEVLARFVRMYVGRYE